MTDQTRKTWVPDAIPSAPPLSENENPFTFSDVTNHTSLQADGSQFYKDSAQHNGQAQWDCRQLYFSDDLCHDSSEVKLSSLTPPPDAVDDEPEPSAPPLELMDRVEGYESASFDAVEIPPPLLPAIIKAEDEPQRSPLPSLLQLTEKQAREALLKQVSSHCCYGSGAARDMSITSIKHSMAFHYTLETFTEKRMTCWSFEPYTGGTVDNSSSGTAPFPWDIVVASPAKFQNHVTHTEVPHTASVKTCHLCGGVGRKRCTTCSSNGWEYCYSCHGDGRKSATLQGDNERCFHCHGTGRRRCWKCNGEGMATCKSCAGTGQIKCFIKLTVIWTNHVGEHIVEKDASIKNEKIKSVTGEIVFEEEQPILWPLNHFPDNVINMASVQLIHQHASSFTAEKVLQQRHRVRVIPVAAVYYKWKRHEGLYHVYGYEQKVYAPDYPQTCCCCCIL